jgi:putative nucleotidyltransferase with HDIG domain
MLTSRTVTNTRIVAVGNVAATAVLLLAAGLIKPTVDEPTAAAVLLAFALISELISVPVAVGRLSGSFGAVLAIAWISGPAAGVAAAIVVTVAEALAHRTRLASTAVNVAGMSAGALVAGTIVAAAAALGADARVEALALTYFAAYMAAISVEFCWVYSFDLGDDVDRLTVMARGVLVPLLPQFACMACVTAAMPLLYDRFGTWALTLVFTVLLSFQSLVRALLLSRRRAEQLDDSVRELADREQALERLSFGALRALVQSVNLRDRMTARHSGAVARYARETARELGLDVTDQETVHMAGLLHDVGKHIFDDAILKGDSRLTDDQFELVKQHPAVGAELVRGLPGYEEVSRIVRHHHERVDGRGYPDGLAGEDIPLLSRCISVADTYDVMTSRDSYRKPVPRAEAINELRRVAGSQLDARCVDAFITALARTGMQFDHDASDEEFHRQLTWRERRAA